MQEYTLPVQLGAGTVVKSFFLMFNVLSVVVVTTKVGVFAPEIMMTMTVIFSARGVSQVSPSMLRLTGLEFVGI
jgi:hypothetical protein